MRSRATNVDADCCEYDVVLSPGDPEHSRLTAAGEGILSALRPLATLVTSAAAERVVAAIAKAILTHLAEPRIHPALAKQMVTQGLMAPLHPAVARVYKELGLLK